MELTQNKATKLFVGNIPRNCNSQSLRVLFETIGRVLECDVVKDYAFVHFVSACDAERALKFLDGTNFQGSNLRIQVSHSKVRCRPGMGDKDVCYRCGKEGHWSKDCYLEKDESKSKLGSLVSKEDNHWRKEILSLNNNNFIINNSSNLINGNLINNNITINTINSSHNAFAKTTTSTAPAVHTAQLFIDPNTTPQDNRFGLYDRKPELPFTFSGFSLEFPTQAAFPPAQMFPRDFQTDLRSNSFSENILFQNSSSAVYPPTNNHSFQETPSNFPATVNIRYPINGSNSYQGSSIIGFDSTNHVIPNLHSNRFIASSTNLLYSPSPDSVVRPPAEFFAASQRLRAPIYGMEINGTGIDISSYLEGKRY